LEQEMQNINDMESSAHCPILEACPVYLNNIKHNEMVGLTYRSLYCLQVNKKYKVCTRYHLGKLGRKVPRNILPNSLVRTIELATVSDSF